MEVEFADPSEDATGPQMSDQPEEMETETTDSAVHRRHLEEMAVENTQQYLQVKHVSGQDIDDWCGLPELPARKLGMSQSVSNIFRSSFTILHQEWGCSAADSIPEELRLITPYSLGLVVRLAELAFLTRGGKDEAHATLVKVTRDRCAQMTCAPDTLVFTGMARGMPHKRYVEHRIQEYVGGLMIEDVEMAKALCSTKPRNQEMAVPGESRADRAAKRLNRHAVLPSEPQEEDSHLEAHVGDWGHGPEWANKQQKHYQKQHQRQHRHQQGSSRTTRSMRSRKRRDNILEFRSSVRGEEPRSSELPAVDDDQMHDAMATDPAIDSSRAPPSSPHDAFAPGRTPTLSRQSRNERNRAKAEDRRMVRMFKKVNIDQDNLPNAASQQSYQGPALLGDSGPERRSDEVLPFERSATWPSQT